MTKLLHIIASPRGPASRSNEIARAYIASLKAADPALQVDTLDLWREPLPEFGGDSAGAKMTFFGEGALEGAKKTAWDEVLRIAERFKAADRYVLAAPMWNGGVPYRLKLYIDILTQPGVLFGFRPEDGYFGLLSGKQATAIYTSGVYAPGVAEAYGVDFHSSYIEWWLRFIGVQRIQTIRFQPSLLTEDPAAGLRAAVAEAEALARAEAVPA